MAKLTRKQEYLARSIDRDGKLTLRKAIQQGIDQGDLDTLVNAGRIAWVTDPETTYVTLIDPGIVPDTAPAPTKPKSTRAPVDQPHPEVQLTRQQEYTARWLRRAREVTLRTALQHGVEEATLELLVRQGLAEVSEQGDNPIYRAIDNGAKIGRGPETRPRADIKPLPAPVEQKIVDLLSDGVPRSAGDIASGLLQQERDFIAMRQVGRNVQQALPGLVSRGHLHRIMFGVPTMDSRPSYRYEEKYVAVDAVVPVCMGCFRNYWSMDAVPPQSTGNHARLCSFPSCGRRTNDAAYVPKEIFESKVA